MIPYEEVDVSKMETTTPTGNSAAMREALVMVKRLFDGRLMWQQDIRKAERRCGMKYIIAAAAALFLAGCDEPKGVEKHIATPSYIVRTVEVKGHEYIIFDGYCKGNIIHSEICPCKEGGEK